MKRFIRLCALILALALLFASCAKTVKYRDDLTTSEIADSIKQGIDGGDKLTEISASFIQSSMDIDVSEYADYSVFITVVGTNINEFGIFKAKDDTQVDALKEKLQSYISLRNEAWMPEYLPDEYPKLKNAEIKSVGLYVMYAVLSDSEKEAAFKELEEMLIQ
ncbi:MAG: DUF4358 domain-containing protein [Clostridiales bacterium]|nr:DUF4358 domain-containing protein [Clostridiales bacterium]